MRILPLCLALLATPLSAHEMWIDPLDFEIEPEAMLSAHIVNGEEFVGTNIPFLPRQFEHFVVFGADKAANVQGRQGDSPALNMAPIGDGLHVVAYQSTDATLTYNEWEKFARFADHKGFADIEARHTARDLPRDGFKELYSRYSKSLIAVGSGAGSDRRTGLETEIVALTNPYTDDLSGGMTFQLFYQQDPRANARFEVFEEAPDGTVTQTFYETDDTGKVTVPVKPGHIYQADAVYLREPAPQVAAATGTVWETLWANLTWAVPAD